jgi:hypothetical protein
MKVKGTFEEGFFYMFITACCKLNKIVYIVLERFVPLHSIEVILWLTIQEVLLTHSAHCFKNIKYNLANPIIQPENMIPDT